MHHFFFRYSSCNYIVSDLETRVRVTPDPGFKVTHYARSSRKVLGTNMYRSATYDFVITFHSNHGPILYRFRDKRRFQSKIVKLAHPVYFAPLLKGFPKKLGTGARDQKTRMMGLPSQRRSLTISSAVWIQYTNVTDGRTPGDSKDRA